LTHASRRADDAQRAVPESRRLVSLRRDRTIQESSAAIVAPSARPGRDRARHYADLGADVYRFLPVRYGPDDLRRIHGIDERLAVADYADAVRFYARLIQNLDAR
jgi:carboxypeptidase PM20D1